MSPARARGARRSRSGAAGWRVASAFATIACLPLCLAAAVPQPAEPVPEPTAFMPLEAIRPGMEGTARTVFEGNSLEEFGVRILGVLKNGIGPQQDMILARLHGTKVEFTGVVAGMSGSPVYVDGKLIGALSYRIGAFAKEPIAGITPIADMLKLARGGATAEAGQAGAGPDLLGRFLASDGRAGLHAGEGGAAKGTGWSLGGSVPVTGGATYGMQPIATPLVCSGCDAGVLQYYAPIFEAQGLQPTAGGGGAAADAPLPPLTPGSPIGGALVTGDLSLAGIGTLTHVEGDRVFAFGHPLLGVGPLELPMTQAQVLVTFASSEASFKIANATRPVGTIVQDRLTAVVGQVGRLTPALPVDVRVTSRGGTRRFHYEVLRNRTWSPVMVALTTANSLVRTTDFDATATLALRYRLDLEGFPPLEVEDLYAGTNPAQPVHLALANDVGGLFGLLYNNPFEEPKVRGAEVTVDVLAAAQVATLSSLRASRPEVKPGEPFTVTAVLSLFRGEDRQVTWDVMLPEDSTPGETAITVGGGPTLDGLDRRVIERQLAQATSLGDLVRLAGRQRKSRTLYLRVTRRSPSAIVRSEVLPDLPLSVFSVFNSPRLSADTTLMIEAPILEVPKDLDLVVVGGRRISVRLK